MTSATDELVYRYVQASSLRDDGSRLDLALATSGGCAPNPWLADGFLRAPQTAARALLLVANVAGARFWTPPNMVAAAIEAADPVVTTSQQALRFVREAAVLSDLRHPHRHCLFRTARFRNQGSHINPKLDE